MYCVKCGKLLEEKDKYCTNCGQMVLTLNDNNTKIENEKVYYNENPNNIKYNNEYNTINKKEKKDSANIFLIIVSFFIPLIGLILFLAYDKEKPKFAKSNGIAALVGLIIGIILSFVGIGAFFYLILRDNKRYDNKYNYENRYYDYEIEDEPYDIDEELDEFLNRNNINLNNGNI